ncbi:MAG TPA: type II secretion system protein GspN [Anaeromyxobacter sp.]|nr:type II secretion system protein GspN [Anaeromyxobacter sp.]
MKNLKLDWTVWKRRLAYGSFAVLAFLVALRWTFPSQEVKERLIVEAGTRGWQIDVEDVSAGGLMGVKARGVKLASDTGLSVPIDEATASLRPLPLLIGRRSIAFDVSIYDGRVKGTADLSGDQHVVAEVSGVDLGAALPLRKASGLDLLGRVNGSMDVTVPAAPAAKPSGKVDVRVTDAGLAGGQLPIPGMSGGLPLPRMGFGEVNASVQIADGKATFQRLDAKGGDAELTTQGLYFLVQPRMEFAPIFGTAKVRVAEAFWSKSGTQGFKGLAEAALAQSKGTDGSWNFTVTGSVGHPRVMPAPQR